MYGHKDGCEGYREADLEACGCPVLDPLDGPLPAEEAREFRGYSGRFGFYWRRLLLTAKRLGLRALRVRAARRLDPDFLFADRPIHRQAILVRTDLHAQIRDLKHRLSASEAGRLSYMRELDRFAKYHAEAPVGADVGAYAIQHLLQMRKM